MNQKLFAVVRKSEVGFLNRQPSPLLALAQLQVLFHSVQPFGELGCLPAFLLLPSSSHVPEVSEEEDRKRKIPLDGFGGVLTEHGMLPV